MEENELDIMGQVFELINPNKVRETFGPIGTYFYNKIYSKKKYKPKRALLKIKNISFNNGTEKVLKTPFIFSVYWNL